VREWQQQTFLSPRADRTDAPDEGGTSDVGRTANGWIGGCRGNDGCSSRIEHRPDFWIDVRPGHDRPNRNNAARNRTARNRAAWNRCSDSWHCSSNPRINEPKSKRNDAWDYAEYDHHTDSAGDAERINSGNDAQHAGNNPRQQHNARNNCSGFNSKLNDSGINQSPEQHSPDYNTTYHT
jgi:hypothetical protein